MVRLLTTLAVLATAVASPALATHFPTRQGESGLLDVPDAQVMETRTGMVGLELGFDHAPGTPDHFGPMPLSLGVGLGRLEWAISARESGYPGDARPAPMLFGTALKLGILPAAGNRPAVAIDAYLDRFNSSGAGGGRLILSTALAGRLRLAGFGGWEKQAGGSSGLTAGLAASALTPSGVELVLEGLRTPRGDLFSGAIRYDLNQRVGIGLVGSYLPDTKEYRIAIAFGFHAVPGGRARTGAPAPADAPPTFTEAEPLVAFGDRPLFKLRIRAADPTQAGEPRHLQYAPYVPLAGTVPGAPPRRAAPTSADVVSAQLRDQELQTAARLKRLRSTDDALSTDEANLYADGRKLDERERVLAAREAQLDARERRLTVPGAPAEAQRQLESMEAQLAASERQLAAQERGFDPAREAALGNERTAQAREQADRGEAERLRAQAVTEKNKGRQGDLVRQAAGADQRMLAAMETRLAARTERIEATGRQQRARSGRLETWQRRLDVRTERLDLLERRLAGAAPASGSSTGPGLPLAPLAGEKALFAVVVQAPTAIVVSVAAVAAGAEASRDAVRPGAATDKAVAAATVITFASPTARVSELDRESMESIARLAARENCEVLVWARAKDPSLMTEANRRAEELKAMVISLGNLPARQVVTRITTRPGALGVDVVVSALRESGRARGEAAATEVAPTASLAVGETAKRQIRDAVVAGQPAIERCVTAEMLRRNLTTAEAILRLTVSSGGRLTGVTVGGGDLGGEGLESCLKSSSAAWQFPVAAGEYAVEVPITVVGAGAKP